MNPEFEINFIKLLEYQNDKNNENSNHKAKYFSFIKK